MALKSKDLSKVREELPTMKAADVNPAEALVRLNLNMPNSVRNRFKSAAGARGATMTDVLMRYIASYTEEFESQR